MHRLLIMLVTCSLLYTGFQCVGGEQDSKNKAKNKTADVAIFVKNRAGENLAGKAKPFEDLITGAITKHGFRVISREDTVQAVSSFTGNASATANDKKVSGKDLDMLLDSNTSALRLAQKLQADYMIIAAFTSLGTKKQHLNFRDVERIINTVTLRVTYKILDGIKGSNLAAGTVTSQQKSQQSKTLQTRNSDILNTLLADAAKQIDAKLKEKGGAEAVAEAADKPEKMTVIVSCGMQDLSIPEITKPEEGQDYQVTGNRYKLDAMDVTVAVDGTVIATAPGSFEVYPGLHKMRLTREGFKDWERTVNITKDGQHFDIPLQLSEQGMQRWRENTKFLNDLKRRRKLDDAQIEKVKGFAEMMRKSGYRIDIKGKPDKTNVYQGNMDVNVNDRRR